MISTASQTIRYLSLTVLVIAIPGCSRVLVDPDQQRWSPCRSANSRGRLPRSPTDPHQYAVVIDAGSSGSRVRVYRWQTPPAGGRLATQNAPIQEVHNKKIEPGLSAHAENLERVAADVRGLLDDAAKKIPERLHRTSPVYVMATAGMRQLLEGRMNDVVQYVHTLMSNASFQPFYYQSKHNTRILSGEEEGVFAWITVNYLQGVFRAGGPDVPVVGILEMGGQSTQIAFPVDGNILADKFPVLIGDRRYALYVHSYLNYGQTAIYTRVKQRLIEEHQSAADTDSINNPCILRGDTKRDDKLNRTFTGTGDPYECQRILESLVYKADPTKCQPKPCAVGPFYQPTINPNLKFHAVGSFFHALRTVGALTDEGIYVPRTGFEKSAEFCTKTLEQVTAEAVRDGDSLRYIHNKCLVSLYTAVLFTHGYGLNNDTRNIYVVNQINGQPLDWSLGAILYEDEMEAIYSCSQRHRPSVSEVRGKNNNATSVHLESVVFYLSVILFSIQDFLRRLL